MFELEHTQEPLGSRQQQLVKTSAYQAGIYRHCAHEPSTIQMIVG